MFKNLIQKLKFKKITNKPGVKSIQKIWVWELWISGIILAVVLIFDFLMWEDLIAHRGPVLDESQVAGAAELNLSGLQNFKSTFSAHQKFIDNPTYPFILRDVFK